MIRAALAFFLLLISPLWAATATTKFALTNSAWTDLGAGPMRLSFAGSGVYAIADATPAIPKSEGFVIPAGSSAPVNTSSRVWAMAQGSAGVNAYVAPIAASAPVTSVWSASDATANAMTLSNGGLTVHSTLGSYPSIRDSISKTAGKLYVEMLANVTSGNVGVGVASSSFNASSYLGSSDYSAGSFQGSNHNGAGFTSNYGTTMNFAVNDVVGIAIDFTNGSIWFAQNNVWANSSNPATGFLPLFTFTSATVGALFAAMTYSDSETWTLQATAASQKYAPPAGFSVWDGATTRARGLLVATTTVKSPLTNSAWVDLGPGPLQLGFKGDGVYAISDAAPAIPKSEGFSIVSGKSARVETTSHVWAMAKSNPGVTAYVAAY